MTTYENYQQLMNERNREDIEYELQYLRFVFDYINTESNINNMIKLNKKFQKETNRIVPLEYQIHDYCSYTGK